MAASMDIWQPNARAQPVIAKRGLYSLQPLPTRHLGRRRLLTRIFQVQLIVSRLTKQSACPYSGVVPVLGSEHTMKSRSDSRYWLEVNGLLDAPAASTLGEHPP